ncbi:MAG: phytanoyl-CoA dioxygenase family protein [Roseivirga sp.]|nr:phytanoyl-CoA dioxygenase family protein [Roseivirga sp.]
MMKDTPNTFYGFPELIKHSDTLWVQERSQLENEGYFILENVIEPDVLKEASKRLYEVYRTQISEIGGIENLSKINEENTIRLPFLYDDFFLQFFSNNAILDMLKAVYCNEFILLTQSGLINEPQKAHVGSNWHKDLPYQHYASAQPICINILCAITDFSPLTGSTCFIKGSHKYTGIPDNDTIEQNAIQITAPAGSVVVFNSMLLHRMGHNRSDGSRLALNHMFGTPIFKQHANFDKMSEGRYADDEVLRKLLDYPYAVPDSVISYRENKLKSQNSND